MSIEDRLTSSIKDAVEQAPLPPGDLATATTRGHRLRRRRRMAVVGGSSALVAAIALTAALVTGGTDRTDRTTPVAPDPSPAPGPGSWTRAADSPLSARYGPLMVGVGSRVLIMGGHSSEPCPPGADCAIPDDALTDAAVYDVATDTWSVVAAPPARFARTRAVVADEVVVFGTDGDWITYDPAANTWGHLPAPAVATNGPEAALDGRIYARESQTPTRDVLVLDVATRTWSRVPTDPLTPRLTDNSLFATDAGVVLAGVNYDEAAPDEPTLTQADLWDGATWTRLPRTGQIGPFYHWTGNRLIGLERGTADGGQTNGWDRAYPYGGALDPTTGTWSPVPGLPTDYGPRNDSWSVDAADGPLVTTSGLVYDDRSQTMTDLGRPDSPVDIELTGAWADGRLVVFGGSDEDARAAGAASLSDETWVWTPGSASN
ncbi:hypothetical protein GCM10023340_09750 [Nocardioides marinquilinus]|uniref:Galactose oxidase n=1 Tax=Nocardioides marinquilinus TaxID=1210400 RepID=A0ABP9PAY5_9ACTN